MSLEKINQGIHTVIEFEDYSLPGKTEDVIRITNHMGDFYLNVEDSSVTTAGADAILTRPRVERLVEFLNSVKDRLI